MSEQNYCSASWSPLEAFKGLTALSQALEGYDLASNPSFYHSSWVTSWVTFGKLLTLSMLLFFLPRKVRGKRKQNKTKNPYSIKLLWG